MRWHESTKPFTWSWKGWVFLFWFVFCSFTETTNPIILTNSAHTWFWDRPYFSLSLCFPLLISLRYPHSSMQQNRSFSGLGCWLWRCPSALPGILQALSIQGRNCGMHSAQHNNMLVYNMFQLTFKSMRGFSVFGLILKTMLIQAAQN